MWASCLIFWAPCSHYLKTLPYYLGPFPPTILALFLPLFWLSFSRNFDSLPSLFQPLDPLFRTLLFRPLCYHYLDLFPLTILAPFFPLFLLPSLFEPLPSLFGSHAPKTWTACPTVWASFPHYLDLCPYYLGPFAPINLAPFLQQFGLVVLTIWAHYLTVWAVCPYNVDPLVNKLGPFSLLFRTFALLLIKTFCLYYFGPFPPTIVASFLPLF